MDLVYPIGFCEGTEISWGRNYARNALFYVRSDEVTCCVHIGMLLCSIIDTVTLNQILHVFHVRIVQEPCDVRHMH
ncbi:hypothetical protein CRT38_01872 [Anaplasma phagocytophilum str. CRT38]|uniref:Uncharacterized protein n=1 Tax=Anaplasma phagocytophilum str. CRT38 TaxID=1269275 RepID=S6G5J9_ANAPH|nr:hypothetical protein CRT38_01872 [Anaplasma phagocytophilum str. CRT38]KDB57202.1 hypothetical protein P030_03230 [Anaplasma phagocytophilum str. CRT35]